MKPRTFARRPSSIGSNQLSKSRSSASPAQAVVVLLVMAWSPVRRSNAGISRVANPGDYATPNSNHLRDGTNAAGTRVCARVSRPPNRLRRVPVDLARLAADGIVSASADAVVATDP